MKDKQNRYRRANACHENETKKDELHNDALKKITINALPSSRL
jgi:hypothetical protein